MADFDDHFESPFDSKIPPQNFDAEQTVLANLIYVNEIWYSIADRVTGQDFYHQKHTVIFRAIQSCAEEGRSYDTIIISNWLEKHNQLRLIGGVEYLLELFEKRTGSTKSTIYHADIVREKSILRQLLKVANEISNSVINPQGLESSQLLDNAEKLVFDIAEQGARGQKGFSIIESVISSAMKRIEMLYEKKGAITGISTGFPDLDTLTSGLQNSDLIIIAGRPSMGKCLEKSSQITLSDGSVATIEEIYHRKKAKLLTLGQDWKFHITEASAFVDDGVKPVFKVTTRLGRSIKTTFIHPFLTPQGWKPLCDISIGNKIAVPKKTLNNNQLSEITVYWDEIISIEAQGCEQVYDLTIPETHNFIANDICVHNTAFAMNIAEYVAVEQNIPVAIFSMEMSDEQLGMRLLSSAGKIELQKVRSGNLDDDDWIKAAHAVAKLRNSPLFIDDTAALSPTDLRAKVRRLARELNQKEQRLGLVVIDYLQLMQVPNNTENRALEVSEISRSLKALAKELNIPVVALSQLNRSLEQRADKRPVMSDLRESGSLEQDSDLIIFIYRDEVYNENSEDKGKAEIIIRKQRNGPTGRILFTFLGQFTKFESFTSEREDYS